MTNKSVTVYFKDGTSIVCDDGISWEYENDIDWLKTISTKPLFNYYIAVTCVCILGAGLISNNSFKTINEALMLWVVLGIPMFFITGKVFN